MFAWCYVIFVDDFEHSFKNEVERLSASVRVLCKNFFSRFYEKINLRFHEIKKTINSRNSLIALLLMLFFISLVRISDCCVDNKIIPEQAITTPPVVKTTPAPVAPVKKVVAPTKSSPVVTPKVITISKPVAPVTPPVAIPTESEQEILEPVDPYPGTGLIKIDNSGEQLADTAEDWNCVADAKNNLVWENKTSNGGLRDKNHSYTWYSNTMGVSDGGRCKGGIDCDTSSYVQAMNDKQVCGYSDWRLPTKEELLTLVTFASQGATIDSNYFPASVPSWYWTASTNANRPEYAWYVLFRNGIPLNDLKERPKHIRLVRDSGAVLAGK